MSEKYEKPETQAEEKKDASAQGACGQRYTMGCGALVEKW